MTNLRRIRTDRNCSIKTLAEITGVPYDTLKRWDIGIVKIDDGKCLNTLNVARALGVSLEELIEDFDKIVV